MEVPIKQAPPGASVANPKPAPAPAKPSKPAGWWNISADGTRSAVTAALNASKDLPDYEKSVLIARIAGIDAKYNFVKVDAHTFVVNGRITTHSTVVPSTALL